MLHLNSQFCHQELYVTTHNFATWEMYVTTHNFATRNASFKLTILQPGDVFNHSQFCHQELYVTTHNFATRNTSFKLYKTLMLYSLLLYFASNYSQLCYKKIPKIIILYFKVSVVLYTKDYF